MPPPVNLKVAAACLKDMPSPVGQGETVSRSIPDPDVSEWSGLLVVSDFWRHMHFLSLRE